MQSPSNSNEILHRDRKINLKVQMETQKTSNTESSHEQKRAMLEVLKFLTSNYTIKPEQ
jgi:hypothetical protein